MAQTEKQTSADVDQTITSDQNQATKDQSDSPSLEAGYFEEEALSPDVEEKMVITDQGVLEGDAAADFVAALNTPTPEQNPQEAVPPAHEGIVGNDFFNTDEQWQATVLGETTEGRTLQVMKRKEGAGYYLAYREGLHKVPREIEGWFTSYDKAELAGRTYLNRQWDEQNAAAASS